MFIRFYLFFSMSLTNELKCLLYYTSLYYFDIISKVTLHQEVCTKSHDQTIVGIPKMVRI